MPLFTDFRADTLIDQQAETLHLLTNSTRIPPRGALYKTPATKVAGVVFHWRVVW